MATCSTTCVEVTSPQPPPQFQLQSTTPPTPQLDSKPSKLTTPIRPNPDFTPPTYTATQINASIPPHCFHPSPALSLAYIARDIFSIALLAYLCTFIHHLPSPLLRFTAWSLYAFTQGLFFTGFWELAHESGHLALFPRKIHNHIAGLFLHSFLLVPFHSWRITHSHHHKATNNLDKDIAFVPPTHEKWAKEREKSVPHPVWEYMEDMPIVSLIHLVFHQLIAFPLYLTINNLAIPRMKEARWWRRSHFYFGGKGPNFKPGEWRAVVVSDVCIAVMAMVLYFCVQEFGAGNVFCWYGGPYLWCNHWILTITFLQHTSPLIPYYPTQSHTFLRGAASTVDRDSGFIGRHIFHGAIENHVLHHHVSRIPFYYAPEATAAVKEVMGEHYVYVGGDGVGGGIGEGGKRGGKREGGDDTQGGRGKGEYGRGADGGMGMKGYILAWWDGFRTCRFVVETGEGSGVYFFDKGKMATTT